MPERIVNKITAPAPGAAGVPIEATRAKIPIIKIEPKLTSYPPHTAMKMAAITCIIAVPSMFTVIPSGKTNDDTSSLTPNSSVVVFKLSGSVAAELEVEKPNIATLAIFFTNVTALKPVATFTNKPYPTTSTNNRRIVVMTT